MKMCLYWAMPGEFAGLKLFVDVAISRSVSRAALMNGVSQSAVSQRLQEMERLLGVKLLDRSRRPLELTEAGRIYCQFCQGVLRRRQRLDDELDKLRGQGGNEVRVAAIYSVGIPDMSRFEEELARSMPGAELEVEFLRPEKVHDAVVADRADLGLVSYPQPDKDIAAIPWRKQQMMVVAAPSHPLASRDVLRPAELSQQDFVAFDDDLRVGWEVKRYLREGGARVNVVMHFDNVQTMKEAVTLGTGISILPVQVLREDLEEGRLVAIPLEGRALVRPLGVIHRRRKKFNRATQAFLNVLWTAAAAESEAPARPAQPRRLAHDEAPEGSGE
jgi:DNA-binding transcriptional LysR family regulator